MGLNDFARTKIGIELSKLLFDYSASHKLIDTVFYEKAVQIIVDVMNLGDYVSSMEIVSGRENNVDVALYSYDADGKGKISICPDAIQILLDEQDRYTHLFDNDFELYFYKNLMVVQKILVELEQAYQMNNIHDDIEGRLLTLGYAKRGLKTISFLSQLDYPYEEINAWLNYNKGGNIDIKNGQHAPQNRLAKIKSFRDCLSIVSCLINYIPSTFEFVKALELEALLEGYKPYSKRVQAPTIKYLSETGGANFLRDLDWYDKSFSKCLEKVSKKYYSYDRMTYGLPISIFEYQDIKKRLLTTNKYSK